MVSSSGKKKGKCKKNKVLKLIMNPLDDVIMRGSMQRSLAEWDTIDDDLM